MRIITLFSVIRDGSGSGSVRVSAGFDFSGFGFGVVFSPKVFRFGFGFGFRFGFGFWFPPVDIQWISEINHLELKLMFYNILMITCLLRLLNLLKVDSWKYYYLLPLVYTCEYVYIYPRVLGIRGFGFDDEFPPESVSGSCSGFVFRCTETPPDPNPTCCHP